jgi:hypothetical protein
VWNFQSKETHIQDKAPGISPDFPSTIEQEILKLFF